MSTADAGLWPSDEWVEQMAGSAGSRPAAPGCTGTVSLMIGTGKRGARDVHYHWSYRDGVPGDGGVGPLPEADLTLTITPADAVDVASGSVSPSVAFMRGRLKANGDGGLLLGFLESTAGKEYEQWRTAVASGLLDGAPQVLPGGPVEPKARKTAKPATKATRREAAGSRSPAATTPED